MDIKQGAWDVGLHSWTTVAARFIPHSTLIRISKCLLCGLRVCSTGRGARQVSILRPMVMNGMNGDICAQEYVFKLSVTCVYASFFVSPFK